jgi:glyoxylase-like metal-dependent hydrolase (beta-lactamase superfamily II)
LKLWQGKRLSLPSHAQGSAQPKDETSDFVAIKTGGHFPGSSVLWWKSARKLLIADTIMIVPSGLYRVDRPAGTVSYAFMWSYPNYVSVHRPDTVNRLTS